jgi:hypothetical protein
MKPRRANGHKVRKDHSPEYAPESLNAAGSAPTPTSALLIHGRPAATWPRHQAKPPRTAWSHGSPVPFPDADHPATGFTTSKRERVPWRTVGTGIASLGTPAVFWIVCPVLGVVIAAIEAAAMLTIIGTALFGSQALSERAFRLLRWLVNRPEPPSPAPGPPARSHRRNDNGQGAARHLCAASARGWESGWTPISTPGADPGPGRSRCTGDANAGYPSAGTRSWRHRRRARAGTDMDRVIQRGLSPVFPPRVQSG